MTKLADNQRPIAAPASGLGAAAVSVVRLSGETCHELLASCLKPSGKAPFSERVMRLCRFMDPDSGEVIDEPLAVLFKGPRSFTGEDAAEVHLHGGPYIVRRVLSVLYKAGFRAAEPGEFTRRAFLNGKLDLTAAEGVRELVEAQSQQQWLAARQLATGKLKDHIEAIRARLIETMAYLEAQIDFPDEGDVSHLQRDHVRRRIDDVTAVVRRLASTYESGRVASRGLMVAIFGRPNAGKSSLMNELLGKQRAIVTDIAGTTRDYLEESCLVEGRLIRLVDMAGVRESQDVVHDKVEQIGIDMALRMARDADLVVFLVAADTVSEPSASSEVDRWIEELNPRQYLKVLNKVDLQQPAWLKDAGDDWLSISCQTGEGLADLRRALAARVDRHVGGLAEETFVTSARHAAALEDALRCLEAFRVADAAGHYEEMLAFELQQAARALKSIIGDVGSEDILDKVFSEFCIGK